MWSTIGKKIHDLRISRKETQAEFGEHFGVEQATVSRWEGGKPVKREFEELLAKLANQSVAEFFLRSSGETPSSERQETEAVQVMGIAEAGVWRENPEYVEKIHSVPIIPLIYPDKNHYALLVHGSSADEEVSHGHFAIFVPYWEVRTKLQNNDIVHVRRQEGVTVETSIRRIKFTGDKITLHFCSKDSAYQNILEYTENLEIKGLFIGSFKPHPAAEI